MKKRLVAAMITLGAMASFAVGLSACGEEEHTHTLTEHKKVAATCTTDGTEAYWSCSDTECGKLFSDEKGETEITAVKKISKTAHSFTAEKAEDKYKATEATCTAKATYYKSCSVCGEKGTETFEYGELAAHTLEEHAEAPATCTSNGTEAYWYCSVCETNFSDAAGTTKIETVVTIPATGHKLTETKRREATCTEAGYEAYWTCSVCHKLFSDAAGTTEITAPKAIAAKGHSFTQEVAEDKFKATEATCTAKATYYKSCSCGEKGTETFEYGELAAHSYVEDAQDTYKVSDATCTAKATYHNFCSVCGVAGTETFEHGDYAHTYDDVDTTGKKCTVCGLTFTLNSDGTAYTVTAFDGTGTEIAIPAKIGDIPITAIAANTFKDNKKITSVSLGDVTEIGDCAFEGCTALATVDLSKVTKLGAYAFKSCTSLTSVDLTALTSAGRDTFNGSSLANVTLGNNLKELPQDMFKLTKLVEVTIPDGVETIGQGAFYQCYYLATVKIGDGVTSIVDGAFRYCYNLVQVTLGMKVTTIDSNAFSDDNKLISVINLSSMPIEKGKTDNGYIGNYALEVVTKAEDSKLEIGTDNYAFYTSTTTTGEGDSATTTTTIYLVGYKGAAENLTLPDGYGTEKKPYEIYKYAFYNQRNLKTLVIPANVTKTGYDSFAYCVALESVDIKEGLTELGQGTFWNCVKLKSVVIPKSVTKIDRGAFDLQQGNDTKFEKVYYGGTAEDWGKISIDATGSKNAILDTAIRYYYSATNPFDGGTVTEGNYWYYDQSGNIAIWQSTVT